MRLGWALTLSVLLACQARAAEPEKAQPFDLGDLGSLGAAYQQLLREGKHDLYVTPDLAFEQVHLYFSDALESLEREQLGKSLAELLAALGRAAKSAAAAETDPLAKDALASVLAHARVAAALLGGEGAAGPVAAEVALINEAAKTETSPVMGYREDYTQYLPRGHYAKDERLAAYFRAVMWLGRAGFYLETNPAAGIDEALARRLRARGIALLALVARTPEAKHALSRLEALLQAWIGDSDDTTVAEALPVAAAALGKDLAGVSFAEAVAAADKVAQQLVAKGRRPRIASTFLSEGSPPPFGIKLLGQRYLADSFVLYALSFDRVGAYQGSAQPFTLSVTPQGRKVRGVPRGLDVMAALGSSLAREELKTAGDVAYEGYQERAEEAARAMAAANQGPTFAARYFSAVAENLSAAGPCAWRERVALNGSLGAWALLRHDLAAYGKQSYTAVPRSFMPPAGAAPAKAILVAPAEKAFRALAEATAGLQPALQAAPGLESQAAAGKTLAAALELLARNAGKTLSAEDAAAFAHWVEAAGRAPLAVAADVHTDAISGQVLQAAVGGPQGATVTPCGAPGKAYAGALLSVYELRRPMAERLTDKAWRDELRADPVRHERWRFRWETGK